MKTALSFSARVMREGKWFITFSPEFPEGNGQGETKSDALKSLRQSILLLIEECREDARAELPEGEALEPLAFA